MGATLTCLCLLAGLMVPGLLLSRALAPGMHRVVGLGAGVALGLGIAIIKAVAWQRLGLLGGSGMLGVEIAISAICAAAWVALIRGRSLPGGRAEWALAGLALLGVLVRMLPHRLRAEALMVYDAPAHCTIAAALLASPGQASWLPFMDAPLRYPYGAHALAAQLHLMSGAPLEGCVTLLLTAGAGALGIICVGALARLVWTGEGAALGAAFAYAFLSLALGVTYSRWGGLPSALAFVQLLGLAVVLLHGGRLAWAAPLLVLGILLSNHLVAGMAGVLGLSCVLVVAWVYPSLRSRLVWLCGGAVVAGLLALPVWWPIFTVDVSETRALGLNRQMDLPSLGGSSIGLFLIALALLGLFAQPRPRKLGSLVLLCSVATLCVAFVGLFTVAKLVTGLGGDPRIFLVPSRWAAALTFPLAVMAGGGLRSLWERLGAGIAAPLLLALGLSCLYPLRQVHSDPPEGLFEAFRQAGARAQAGDLIVPAGRHGRWAGCLSRMPSSVVPAPPGSDPLTPRLRRLRGLSKQVKAGGRYPSGLAELGIERLIIAGPKRRIGVRKQAGYQTLWEADGYEVGAWTSR